MSREELVELERLIETEIAKRATAHMCPCCRDRVVRTMGQKAVFTIEETRKTTIEVIR